MLLLAHIVVAVSGLASALYAVLRPSELSIVVSKYFLVGTLMSGTVLIVFLQTGMLRACISGLTMSAVMYAGIVVARNRLSTNNVT